MGTARKQYAAEFKAQVVQEMLRETKEEVEHAIFVYCHLCYDIIVRFLSSQKINKK